MARAGLSTQVFVPPYNRFDASQYDVLSRRFKVVCGGPESIGRMGFQRTPQWRGESVYLPAYTPFYGHAAEVLPAVEHAIEACWGIWVPIVLHWGWEADAELGRSGTARKRARSVCGPLGGPRRGRRGRR